MKIIIHDLAAHPFVFQLSKELAKRNIKVFHLFSTFFQSPNQGNLNNIPSIPNLELVPIDIGEVYSKTNFFKRRRGDILYGKAVSGKIKEIKPAIFINCVSPLDTSKIIQKACFQENIKFITWLQDIYSVATKAVLSKKIPGLGKVITSYYEILEKRHLRKSEHIVSITEDFIPLLSSWGIKKQKISVIPNWANINDIPFKEKNNEWATKNDLHDKFCFLYSGTLGFKHNPALLSNLAMNFKNNPDVRIVVVSEGQGADWLNREKASKKIDNLIIMNFQSFEELPNVLATGDVLISILEQDAGIYSVPSKVLTYLCAQRPLLLSIPSGNLAARIVKDNNLGLVVNPLDMNSFQDAATELYIDKGKRELFAQNAREYAENNFNIEKIVNSFLEIINVE
ncbi:MAG: glycosyltransferase family 4 protein [Ignavibacteriaceae bacterium]